MSASNSFKKESMQKLNNSFSVQKQNLQTELSTITINNKIRSCQLLTMTTDNLLSKVITFVQTELRVLRQAATVSACSKAECYC